MTPPRAEINFTPREREVLQQAIWQAKATKIIAHDLGVTEDTVRFHIKTIMRKMEVRTRTQLIMALMRTLCPDTPAHECLRAIDKPPIIP